MKKSYLLLIIATLISSALFSQQMSGTYTVYGVNPSFSSLETAFNALEANGINGAVTLDVRPGIHFNSVTIDSIPGSSSTNTITIRPDTAFPGTVSIQSPSTQSSTYTIKITGSSFIKFKSIQLLPNNGSSMPGSFHTVHIVRGNNLEFDSCTIKGIKSLIGYHNFSCFYEEDHNANRNLKITNSQINGGNAGLYLNHYTGFEFSDNSVTGFKSYGLRMNLDADTLLVKNNIFQNDSSAVGLYGVILQNCGPESKVCQNQIKIYATLISSSPNYTVVGYFQSGYGMAYSNTVSITGPTSVKVIGMNINTSISYIYNNSVLINAGDTATSAAFYFLNGGYIDHNIFVAKRGFALHNQTSATIGPNNVLYGNEPMIKTGSSTYTIDSYFPVQLKSFDPEFLSDTDLHTFHYYLNSTGGTSTDVTTDIDQQLRGMPRDLGADEFALPQTDVGFPEIINPLYQFCTANILEGNVTNAGSDTLQSYTLNWSVNGIQGNQTFSGLNLPTDSNHYFNLPVSFTPGDTMTVWVSQPNGVSEIPYTSYNDTIHFIVPPYSLVGNYQIGGPGADFPNFSAVDSVLDISGICGPVTFLVSDSIYNEKIQLDSIKGQGHPIVFKSISGDSSLCVLSWSGMSTSSLSITLSLAGMTNVSFEGIGFLNNNTTNLAYNVSCFYEELDVTFRNCYFYRDTIAGTGYLIGISYNLPVEASFFNCRFKGGLGAIDGQYFNSFNPQPPSRFTIDSCEFINQRAITVAFEHSDSVIISNSTFHLPTGPAGAISSIEFQSSSSFEISNNTFLGGGISPTELILLEYCESPSASPARIHNNFFSTGFGSYQGTQIYLNSTDTLEIFNNNFYFSGTHSNSYSIGGLYGTYSYGVKIRNNAFKHSSPGLFYFLSPSYWEIDNNSYHFSTGGLGRYLNTNYNSLSSWTSATPHDDNSFFLDPMYASTSDLHVCNGELADKGVPLGITWDYDYEPRTGQTDIGADELTGRANLGADQFLCDSLPVTLSAGQLSYGNSFLWSTGDTTTAITVNGQGNYWLTVNSQFCGNSTDSVNITYVPPVNASFSYSNTGLDYQFSANSSNIQTYSWNLGDGTTSSIQNPQHTYQAGGNYTVSLLADNFGCTESESQVINVIDPTAVTDHSISSMTLHPNPSNGQLYVSVQSDFDGDVLISDMNGKVIYNQQINLTSSQNFPIDLTGLTPGVYLAKFSNNNSSSIYKIIIR